MEPNLLKEHLREKRLSAGFSIRSLAAKAGVGRSTLSDWETGHARPRIPELEAVLNVLDLPKRQRQDMIRLIDTSGAAARLREQLTPEEVSLIGRAGTAPGSGDVLRSIRLRNGWTLETAAQRLGVRHTTLSRWERGEIWPASPGKMLEIGRQLGANAEELKALGCGRLGLHLSSASALSFGALEQAFRTTLVPIELKAELNPGMEIHFLRLESALWQLARHHDAAYRLLAEVYAHHGNYLFNFRRWREADVILNRVLDMMNGTGKPPPFVLTAAIRTAEFASWKRLPGSADHSVRLLNSWRESAAGTTHLHWLMRKLPMMLALGGHYNDALECTREADTLLIGKECERAERRELQRARAGILLSAQQYGEAIDHLPPDAELYAPSQVRDSLTRTHACLGLGRKCEAHDWLSDAICTVEANDLSHWRSDVNELANRF